MLFKKDKKIKEYEDLLIALKRKNDMLKAENTRLQMEMKGTNFYKEEYARLCEDIKDMKSRYAEKLEIMNELEKEYKNYLDSLKNKR